MPSLSASSFTSTLIARQDEPFKEMRDGIDEVRESLQKGNLPDALERLNSVDEELLLMLRLNTTTPITTETIKEMRDNLLEARQSLEGDKLVSALERLNYIDEQLLQASTNRTLEK